MVSFRRLSAFSMVVNGVKAGFAVAHACGSLDSDSPHAHMKLRPTTEGWPNEKTSNKGISVKGGKTLNDLKFCLSEQRVSPPYLFKYLSGQWGTLYRAHRESLMFMPLQGRCKFYPQGCAGMGKEERVRGEGNEKT